MNPEEKSSSVEDLTVNDEEGANVKGGIEVPYYLKLQSVEGDSTAMGGPTNGGWNLKESKKL